jgi:hypothetical protein
MGNGVGNGGKIKQFFKNVGRGVIDGLGAVVDVVKKVVGTPGVTDAINMRARAFGLPVNVGDMISSGVGIASSLLGSGNKKRDILKDPNKYDFNSGYDQFSSLIKRKEGPVWKK